MRCNEDCFNCKFEDCVLGSRKRNPKPLIDEEKEYDLVEYMKKKRTMLGMTQRELADEAGVSATAIGTYERHISSPSIETAKMLLEVLGGRIVIKEGTA